MSARIRIASKLVSSAAESARHEEAKAQQRHEEAKNAVKLARWRVEDAAQERQTLEAAETVLKEGVS